MASADDRLARRYRRLLIAYPPAYRAERGDELVATLLDGSPPGARLPSLADAADLVASGLRRRLGTAAVIGLEAGLVIAAPFALAIAAGIGAFAWWRVEPITDPAYVGGAALFGQFRTLGPLAYAAWILAAVGYALFRPALGRVLIGVALLTTLALPALAPVTGVDRPPLWVLMALAVFGCIALVGSSASIGAAWRRPDERLAVPIGAIALAICASVVVLAWPPGPAGFGYYYQPTIARVGTVVAATVAIVAVIAVVRTHRSGTARDWLWATALLGLPAGWLGPFDSNGLRSAADQAVPQFGRLAQVLLATCLAAIAMAWLVQPRGPRRRVVDSAGPLAASGHATLGAAAGLGAFIALADTGLTGFSGTAGVRTVPGHVAATLAVLVAGGLLAAVAGRTGRTDRPPAGWQGARWSRARWSGVGVAAGVAAAWAVAAYDNDWTLRGWTSFDHTVGLVATLALVPLSACAALGSRALANRSAPTRLRVLGGSTAGVCVGWLAYLTVPYMLSWGPVVLALGACCGVLAISSRPSSSRG